MYSNAETNTELTWFAIDEMESKLNEMTKQVEEYRLECNSLKEKEHFRLNNIKDDDEKIKLYAGFSSFTVLMICFKFLGDASSKLNYWGTSSTDIKTSKGRKRMLSPLEEFFLVLVQLHLGLFEQGLAYRFAVSQSTVSRIVNTWINFIYLQFKQLPLWAPRDLNMPKCFKEKYPHNRVIIDATEIFVEQPAIPELQQLTFSSYKNHNTYKGLIGISPTGAVVFVLDLYPGSISDKLTQRCGIIDMLDKDDAVMADRGFDIEELKGVKLNIPPFLKGKLQLSQADLRS